MVLYHREPGTKAGYNVLKRLEEANKVVTTVSPHNQRTTAWGPPEQTWSDGGGMAHCRQGAGDVGSTVTKESEPIFLGNAQAWVRESDSDHYLAPEDSQTISSVITGETKTLQSEFSIGAGSVESTGIQAIPVKEKRSPGSRYHRSRTCGFPQGGIRDTRHCSRMSSSTEEMSWTDDSRLLGSPERKRLPYTVLAEQAEAVRALEVLTAKIRHRGMRTRALFNVVRAYNERDRRRKALCQGFTSIQMCEKFRLAIYCLFFVPVFFATLRWENIQLFATNTIFLC